MSVVGFDFGTQNSRIAVVRGGGVDVICNEVSDRATPSMVSFDAKRRFAGDASRTQQVSNFRNTVMNLPRLVGRLPGEDIAVNEQRYETCRLAEKEGVVAVTVNYLGEERTFSNTELTGMFLNKLKSIVSAETKAPVSDVVISVPSYFGEKERRALMDAAEVAGLNCLRTVNDLTAAAVTYGMMKTDVPSDKARLIAIVDVGHASFKAAIVSVVKGSVEMKGHVSDPHLGGRDFDEALASHFASNILSTHRFDVRENKKAMLRLRTACERIKKVLSGIQMTKLELEALFEGHDVCLEATRVQLEELSAHLLGRIGDHLRELLAQSSIKAEDIEAVEIIGGATRIPAVKTKISEVFGKEVSTTLNADEAVSRGCALLCAMDSPLVRVREFKVADLSRSSIFFSLGDHIIGELPEGSFFGVASKFMVPLEGLSFPFTISAHYSHPEVLPTGVPQQVAKFTFSTPKSLDQASVKKVIVAPMISASGCVEIEDSFAETETSEPGTPADGQDPASVPPRVVLRTFPLTVKAETFRIPRQTLTALKEAEIAMTLGDKNAAEIDDSRNAVEEFIYEGRQKLDDVYAGFCEDSEKEAIREKLAETESWLYDEGLELGKTEYVTKLNSLKALFKPLESRFQEKQEEARSAAAVAEHPKSAEGDWKQDNVPSMDMD